MAQDLTGLGEASKAIVELYKESGIKELMKTLFGPAAKELGSTLGDIVKSWREENVYRALQKAQKRMEEKKISGSNVDKKFLLKWTEEASFESNESMQEKWANLLMSSLAGISIHPKYVETLRLLDVTDANVLEIIRNERRNNNKITNDEIITQLKQKGIDVTDEILRDTLSNLVTRDLCDVSNLQGKPTYNEMNVENVRISYFGNKFLNIVNGES
ncbi:Abi-alpha family protein [Nostoc sp. ChiVER01]|uniref:Abi-alpha family protein n=1 Tax=Nostoc sp. ChiVER01 TaxID=3075382 RepID=UPI002AD2E100|nr:Abi-alpha family protein [Nostoc sp. ChiVER01]MDZ8223835.1 Abi-alpha family protein [Nostoc sp. ChiVER01]